MRRVHLELAVAVAATLALLAALGAAGAGLTWPGVLAAIVVVLAVVLLLGRGLARAGRALGPADAVTLGRAVLVAGVTGLVASAAGETRGVGLLVALASAALLLDAVDGRVARRTRTASALGARFDMEVDAWLILVLSLAAARELGVWVVLIGLARYLLLAATRVVPWLDADLPGRWWNKLVAAVQGVALTAAVSGLLGRWAGLVVAAALLLLAESFGHQVWRLRHRHRGSDPAPGAWRAVVGSVAALAVLVASLLLPREVGDLTAPTFVALPVELLGLVGAALLLGRRVRRVVTVGFGLALGALVLVKALDMAFEAVMDRPFDPVDDWAYLGPGYGVLEDSVGATGAALAAAVLAGVLLVMLAAVVWAAVRVAEAAARHRRPATRTLVAAGCCWVLAAALGLRLAPGTPAASAGSAELALDVARQVRADLSDREVFAEQIADDPLADVPATRLVHGLRGKDVLLVFVESYGRVAVEGTSYSPGVAAVLDDGTARLRRAGYDARSGFLTSPTFGAASWLAHATAQSGVWVDSQRRYNQLMTAQRRTLTSTFGDAGWRTVFDVPAITHDWADGPAYYGMDQVYDARNVGYRGPRFSYATMPDQYTLAAFARHELTPGHRPVMAEIDLVSSHHPWTPLPTLVPWDRVGDGSVFDPMPARGDSPEEVFADPERVREVYGRSVEYSWECLVSFLEARHDPDLVLLVLGDHQPHSYVTGPDPDHDVPVTLIAADPGVLARTDPWGWTDGLRPAPDAPVWRMDQLRDRFLDAMSRP